MVPIGDSFLYFEPIYLKATSGTGLPELKKVILADQTQVAYADNLQQALNQLVAAARTSANHHATTHDHAGRHRPDRRPGDPSQPALREGLRGAQVGRPHNVRV